MNKFSDYARKLDEAIRPPNYGNQPKSTLDKAKEFLFGDPGDTEDQYARKSRNLYEILATHLGLGISRDALNYLTRGPLASGKTLSPYEQSLLKFVHSAIGDATKGGVRPKITREDASRLMQALNLANVRFDDKTPEGLIEYLNNLIARTGEALTISDPFAQEIATHNSENLKDIKLKRKIARERLKISGPQHAGDALRNYLSNNVRLSLIQSLNHGADKLEQSGNSKDADIIRLFVKGLT